MVEGTDSSLYMQGDETFHETNQVCLHNLLLLIKVVQSSRKLLPVGSYTERLVSQMVNRIVGVEPLGVTVMNVIDMIVELRERRSRN